MVDHSHLPPVSFSGWLYDSGRPALFGLRSTPIFPEHFRVREDMPLHGPLDVGLRRAHFQIQFRIQRIQLEEISVRIARRRTGPSVPDFAEIVSPLPGAIRKLLLLRHAFRQFSRVRRQVEQHPMNPRARRSIGVVHNQREALRLCRRLRPVELRRGIRPIARKFLGNRFAGSKRRAGDLHRSPLGLRKWSCTKVRGEAQRKTNHASGYKAHKNSPFYSDTHAAYRRTKSHTAWDELLRNLITCNLRLTT